MIIQINWRSFSLLNFNINMILSSNLEGKFLMDQNYNPRYRIKIKIPTLRYLLLFAFTFFYVCGFYLFSFMGMAITTNYLMILLVSCCLVFISQSYRFKYIVRAMGSRNLFIYLLFTFVWGFGVVFRSFFPLGSVVTEFKWHYIVVNIFSVIVMPLFILYIFKGLREFCSIYSNVMVFQSIIIIAGIFFKPVREIFIHLIIDPYKSSSTGYDSYYNMYMDGLRGFGIGIKEASGSVIMLSSLVLLIYNVKKGLISRKIFFIKYFIILTATLFVGRTGLYFGIIILLLYLFQELWSGNKKKKTSISASIVLATVFFYIAYKLAANYYPEIVIRYTNWVTRNLRIFDKTNTVSIINDMSVPKLTWETFWGTNIMRGITVNGTVINNDQGYVKMYASLGLFGSFFYYLSYLNLWLFLLLRKKISKWKYLIICIIILFIIEWKEPFIQAGSYPFVLSVMIWYGIFEHHMAVKPQKPPYLS